MPAKNAILSHWNKKKHHHHQETNDLFNLASSEPSEEGQACRNILGNIIIPRVIITCFMAPEEFWKQYCRDEPDVDKCTVYIS